MRITYHAVFQYDGDGICIHFPDVPAAITCAYSFDEGVYMASDVLVLVLHGTAAADLPTDAASGMQVEANQKLVPITVEMENRNGTLFGSNVIDLR